MGLFTRNRFVGLIACCAPAIFIFLVGALIASQQLGVQKSQPFDYVKTDIGEAAPTLAQITSLPNSAWTTLPRGETIKGEIRNYHYWMRVEIPPVATDSKADEPQTTVVGIPLMYVQDVEFYLQDHAKNAPREVSSGRKPSTWESTSEPVYRITASPKHRQFLYVHLLSTRLLKLPLYVLSAQDYRDKITERQLFLSIINGGLLFMMAIALVLYFLLHQPLYLYSCSFQAFLALVLSCTNGALFHYLPWLTATPYLHQLLIIEASTFAILSFGLAALEILPKLPSTATLMRRWKTEIMVVFALMVLAPAVPSSLHTVIVAVSLVALVAELTAFLMSPYTGIMHMRPIIVMGSSFWSTFLLTLLAISGILPNSIYLENAYAIGQFWAAVILAGEIARRTRTLDTERLDVLNKLKSGDALRPELSSPTYSEELHVSIMFIDIISFSVISEHRSPESTFKELSKRLRSLTEIIERHGGTIDRSLGDGLLCFFGDGHGQEHHAMRAFRAAAAIQQSIMAEAKVALALEEERILMPVRIGIHSDQVVIGNIAGAMQIDFTMVGQGVNFASNLEQACGPFQIMVSHETYTLLIANDFPASMFSSINIAVKHRHSLLQAFEHNPFMNESGTVDRAMNLHYGQLGMSAREVRYAVHPESLLTLVGEYGEHQVLDFSLYGFRARSTTFLGQHAIFEATIHSSQSVTDHALSEKLLRSLTIEVRWSRSYNNYFEHGLKIVGSSQEQAHFRVALMLASTGPSHAVRRLA